MHSTGGSHSDYETSSVSEMRGDMRDLGRPFHRGSWTVEAFTRPCRAIKPWPAYTLREETAECVRAMGQTLRRAKGAAVRAKTELKQEGWGSSGASVVDEERPLNIVKSAPARPPPGRDDRFTMEGYVKEARRLRTSEIRPEPPQAQPIIEPENNTGNWNRSDPNYKFMVQQIVGKITTRPGGKQEMGEARVSAESSRPKPQNRHTTVSTGPDEDYLITPGKLNIHQMKQVYLLYHGRAEGEQKPLDVDAIAKRFNVDPEMLKKLFLYTSLPEYKPADAEAADGALPQEDSKPRLQA